MFAARRSYACPLTVFSASRQNNSCFFARLTLRALIRPALIFAFAASQVALTLGDPLPPSSIQESADSASTSCIFGWSPAHDLPVSEVIRAVGVYFPANGRFYAMGGRSSDSVGADFTHPFEYNRNTNTWITKAATFPDTRVSNMACGVLTVGGTPQIYCAGGSAGGGSTGTSRVFSYNPITDTITTLSALDNWPGDAGGTTIPGGFAVVGNKLYLIGGYNFSVGMTAQTWRFDPTAAAGSRWLQRLNYPLARGYLPAASIGGLIYTSGGLTTSDNINFTDTSESFKYDPVANTWTAIAPIPRMVSHARAVVVNGEMWVLGGGLAIDQTLAEVDIYTPATNTWSLGPRLLNFYRDYSTDSDGSDIWLAGGYYAFNETEIYEVVALSERFDGVTAPALPAGWVATNAQGPAPLWVTTTTDAYIPPNDAFVDDPSVISDKYLDTPPISITSAAARVSFRNYYRLETGFDGGVLEVSSPNINGGAFTDVIDPVVGGSFASFGYDATIDTGSGNPLAGRRAWSGNSLSYGLGFHIPTHVNLGPNLAGQTIKLRFRMGSDISDAFTGWQIDYLWVAEPACAPTWIVTTVADHDDSACNAADCTLREAIDAANSHPGSVISFAPGVTGTIQLASALPALNADIALQGPGANLLTVRRNAGGAYRIFTVSPSAAVSFSGLTIANGDANGNSPPLGGGIYNDHGIVSLTSCAVNGNTAYTGGGISSRGSSAGNASLAITNSTLNANSATGALGEAGAIDNEGGNGIAVLKLTNCTISGNSAVIGAAAIENFGGGGSATATVRNCTFNGNNINNDSATLIFANTLLAASPGGNLVNSNGTIVSQGHNLSSDAAGGDAGTLPGGFLNGPGDQRNTNPQLNPGGLANNGGPTQTIALLANSPAINTGNDVNAPLGDQRNYVRVGVSDIGAFEFGGAIARVVSRKIHGTAGPFDIPLTLTGAAGIECRSGAIVGAYQMIVTFASPVTVEGASVTTGTGSATFNVNGVVVTVDLTGVTNAQTITVTLSNVSDGINTGNVAIPMGVLSGDTNGNGAVSASDVAQTKAQSGQAVTGANFRTDVNSSGSISAADIALVKSKAGTVLPP